MSVYTKKENNIIIIPLVKYLLFQRLLANRIFGNATTVVNYTINNVAWRDI